MTSGSLQLESTIVYLTSSCVKKAQFTHEQVEYNVFLFDEAFNGSKSLKIF
jgi:hypothetical protein